MDTLSWNKTLEPAGRLYYNKYAYSCCLRLVGAAALRSLNHDHIDKYIDLRHRVFRAKSIGDYITVEQNNNLHKICDFLLANTRDKKICVSSNYIYVYTNDLTLLDDLYQFSFVASLNRRHYNERVVTWSNDVVKLQKSQYAYRSYLKSVRFSESEANNVKQYLLAQTEVRLSPSLKAWTRSHRDRGCQDYFFLDHNSESTVQMMALIYPRLISKTKHIVTDK